jgi:predicted amidophosphoribosyltransferase
LDCGETCRHPWLELEPLSSLRARYLLVGRGYEVLKRWKISRGPVFNHRILKPDGAQAELRAKALGAVVPIPQSRHRSRALGGSPVETVALALARELRIPLLRALELKPGSSNVHQAQLPLALRLQSASKFRVIAERREQLAAAKLLLVDDFLTTGRTLKSAAAELRLSGAVEVHGYCLGVRPALMTEGRVAA